jgi:hypothetical protein
MDVPPNLAGTPAYSDVRYAEEQVKLRRKEEEERKKAIEADIRLKNSQTQQVKKP